MRTFKFFWEAHKWTGIVLALFLITISVTGFMLLLKKRNAWIQPPTERGAQGGLEDFLPLQKVLQACFDHDHPDFRTLEDIDRIDFRPDSCVHKVRSRHNYSELQIDAVTGAVLGGGVRGRVSDLLENIHDGSILGDWAHDWFWPVIPVALFFMVFSGLWLWLEIKIRKRKRR